MEKDAIIKEIERLKKEKQALIVAHYYVRDEVQAIADYVGDSYYLSKICRRQPENQIIFCGVAFMGESAKILSPEKTIVMANPSSDCPMAHMITAQKIEEVKKQYEDLAVVCYINSTAEIKAHSDVVVTSSNAYQIISRLKERNIFFVPDEHLGRFIASKLPEKKFIFNHGFCHVHTSMTQKALEEIKKQYPDAQVLVHPECSSEIITQADFVGSTSEIIQYATESRQKEFIIGTESGVLYELRQKNPDKHFHTIGEKPYCPNMKRITLEDVLYSLKYPQGVEVEEKIAGKAKHALMRMHELGE